jgi:hypothetical protein
MPYKLCRRNIAAASGVLSRRPVALRQRKIRTVDGVFDAIRGLDAPVDSFADAGRGRIRWLLELIRCRAG